ncbi:MAG: NAD(P)-dependent oxidoreductase [Pseudomonadota bacterium]
MKDILLHAATFARIAERLKAFEQQVRPLTMDDEGAFKAEWGVPLEGEPQPVAAFGTTDVWFGPQAPAFMTAVLKTPELQWFQSSAAGVEHPALVMIGQKAGLYTTSHAQSEAMAEWALWAAMDFFRGGPKRRADKAAANWEIQISREIHGSHWLIYGFGAIGKAVAWRVQALGGKVTGVRRSGGASDVADAIVTPDAMSEALRTADVVLLCAPHTPETEGMADAAFFAAMRDDALFLNLGRGALVVEPDLIAGLDARRPSFAQLDVVSEEPLPADNPLWSHPNVMITPHDSAATLETRHRQDQVFLDNLERWLKGGPLENLIAKSEFETA